MLDFMSMNYTELEEYFLNIGEKKFRAKQFFVWIHNKLVDNFDDMTDFSLSLREKLSNDGYIYKIVPNLVLKSKKDETRKYLFKLSDDNIIEAVLMKYKHGYSLCISSQVGCRMGCSFCASTIDGLVRNLSVSELLSQIYWIKSKEGIKISNLVMMGSGEPLDNYDNVLKFIDIITSEAGYNLSQRNITISTCGIVPNIYKLADENLTITLALSLHAPNDEIRKALMPVAKKYSIDEVMKAVDYYYAKTKRRVSFEYSLVKGVNDNKDEASKLIKLIGKRGIHINLIPVNPIEERDYKSSSKESVYKFVEELKKHNINATVRRELGRDINGACGQLRRRHLKDES